MKTKLAALFLTLSLMTSCKDQGDINRAVEAERSSWELKQDNWRRDSLAMRLNIEASNKLIGELEELSEIDSLLSSKKEKLMALECEEALNSVAILIVNLSITNVELSDILIKHGFEKELELVTKALEKRLEEIGVSFGVTPTNPSSNIFGLDDMLQKIEI